MFSDEQDPGIVDHGYDVLRCDRGAPPVPTTTHTEAATRSRGRSDCQSSTGER